MSLGPVLLDLRGPDLEPDEAEMLAHPNAGGVVLFSRNYRGGAQLRGLTARIHALREPRLLVTVDQEGGRVQRFRTDFTRLPPACRLGSLHDRDREAARALARDLGWLMASELRAAGVDVSFAPVLDLGAGPSSVIGDRALHGDPEVVSVLGIAVQQGMREAGMAAVGKHYPGHGSVSGDSHHVLPVDDRDLETIRLADLVPFERAIHAGLPAVMPAHVLFPAVDSRPAGFSRFWLGRVLRDELGFGGAVFSDDLSMAAAESGGGIVERAGEALEAGCDVVLVCNRPDDAARLLEELPRTAAPVRGVRLARLHGRGRVDPEALRADPRHAQTVRRLAALEPEPELDLGDDTTA